MVKKILPLLTLAAMILFLGNCVVTTRATVYTPAPVVRTETKVVVKGQPVIVVEDDDPELVVIPGTYVYWLDGHDDVYFYGGYWWRFYGGGWYRSTVYSGSWVSVQINVVPRHVTHLPSGWRGHYHEAPRVRWDDARSNHTSWEKEKHWEKRKWKKAADKPEPKKLAPKKPQPRDVKRHRDDPFDR